MVNRIRYSLQVVTFRLPGDNVNIGTYLVFYKLDAAFINIIRVKPITYRLDHCLNSCIWKIKLVFYLKNSINCYN